MARGGFRHHKSKAKRTRKGSPAHRAKLSKALKAYHRHRRRWGLSARHTRVTPRRRRRLTPRERKYVRRLKKRGYTPRRGFKLRGRR